MNKLKLKIKTSLSKRDLFSIRKRIRENRKGVIHTRIITKRKIYNEINDGN